MYHQSRLLKDTDSPKYNSSSSPSSSTFCSPKCSQYSPLTTHTAPPSLSSLSPWPLSTQPPPTPDRLRHPITLLPVEENFPETSTMFEPHKSLRPPRLSIDLSQDISPYILTLQDKPNMSPQTFLRIWSLYQGTFRGEFTYHHVRLGTWSSPSIRRCVRGSPMRRWRWREVKMWWGFFETGRKGRRRGERKA